MEIIKTKNLSFTYPMEKVKALDNINLSISCGEFVTVCGKSGCGKTTLLRLLKPTLAPHGERSGDIYFCGKPAVDINSRSEASEIGFIMQNPDEQIVTDKVWHELAFGLESLGVDTPEIRRRVAEMSSFFGIEKWFHKKTTELSGGEKQLLNLASVMIMGPQVLLLDEPTSQLDPIWAESFLQTLKRINLELGVTVILTEHRLHTALPISDRVVVMEKGRIIADDTPQKIGAKIKDNDMYKSLPVPMRVYGELEDGENYPVSIRDGRLWLNDFSKSRDPSYPIASKGTQKINAVIEVKDVWYRYEKTTPDVIKGLSLEVNKGEVFAIVGGNGTGKTTLLSLVSGLYKPYRGKILINGKRIEKTDKLYSDILGVVPQNPEMLFIKSTVRADLEAMAESIDKVTEQCHIKHLLDRHPYDLSGGEKQRVALAKVLLKNPQIILMDEPTKGMDAHFKAEFGGVLNELKEQGRTVVMVSHDVEFCAEFTDRCAYMFDGIVVSESTPREFFSKNIFYTTQANKMARDILPDAILAEDIVKAFKGEIK